MHADLEYVNAARDAREAYGGETLARMWGSCCGGEAPSYVDVDSDIPLRASGEFEHIPTPQLLWDISLRQFTGSLIVRSASEGLLRGESCFAFEEGRLAQARLPTACDALGKVLFDEGFIGLEQLDVSLERMRAGGGLQGAVLVAMGACDRAAVERCLREQLRRKATRLFGLAEGRWELHAHIDLLEDFGGRRMPVDVTGLLWDGVRANATHPLVGVVIERLGTRRLRVVKNSAAMLLYGVGEGERLLLERLADGARVSELLSLGVASSKVRSLVYLLAVTRQLERVRSAPSAPATPPPTPPSRRWCSAPPTRPARTTATSPAWRPCSRGCPTR